MPLVPISCTKKRRHVDRLNNKRESPWISGNFKWTLGVSASQSTELLFWDLATAAAKSLQSCPTLCNPIDSSPPGSPVPGILQARTLEWVAIAFSNAWKWKVKVKSICRVRLSATPWTAAHQAPPPMRFSRQEYWSGVPWDLAPWLFHCTNPLLHGF